MGGMETESHHRVFCWRRVADAGNARVQGVSRRADIRGRAQNCGGREGGEFGAGRKIFGGGRKILAAVAVVAVGVAAGWQGGDELAGDNSPLRNPANLLVSPAFAQAEAECPNIFHGGGIRQVRTTIGRVCLPDESAGNFGDYNVINTSPGVFAAAEACEAAGWTVETNLDTSGGVTSHLLDVRCDFGGRNLTRAQRNTAPGTANATRGELSVDWCAFGKRLNGWTLNGQPNCILIFGQGNNSSLDTIVFPKKSETRDAPARIVAECVPNGSYTAPALPGMVANADWSGCTTPVADASACSGATPTFSPRKLGGVCIAGESGTGDPECDAGIGQILENSVCVVNDTTCSDLDGNAAANSDNTVCVCTHGGTFTGSAGGCNAPPPVSGLLPAGVPATGSISDFEATCLLFGGTINAPNPFVTQCLLPGGAQFEGEDFSIENARDCALDRRPVTGVGSSAACGAQCADGEVVRGNVCVSGTYNQCDQVPSVCAEGQTCSDSTTGTFEGTSEICTTPPSTCTPGPGQYDDSGTCRCDADFEVDTVNGGCVACTDGKTSAQDTSGGNTPCACPTGTTATDDSGKCVANGTALNVANNCESAGWSLNDARTHCEIRSRDFANHGHSPDDCVLSGGQLDATADGPNSVIGCENIFAGRDENNAVTFPARSDTLDATTPRRFFAYCNGDDDPNGGNNAGQTQCCTPPTTDSDMNPDTVCQVTCDDPGETLNEAGDGCTYTDASCLAEYSHSEANSDNTGCVCSVSGGTLGSCAEPAGVSCGTNEVDRNGVCVCEHGGAVPHCHGAAISDADMLTTALWASCGAGGWGSGTLGQVGTYPGRASCVFGNEADFRIRSLASASRFSSRQCQIDSPTGFSTQDTICADMFPDGQIPANVPGERETRFFGPCPAGAVQTNTDPGCACASGNTLVVADNPTSGGVTRACFGDDSVPVACEAAGWDYNIPTGQDGYCDFGQAGLRDFQSGTTAANARCHASGDSVSGSDVVCSDLYLNGAFPRRTGAQGAGQVFVYNCPTNSQLVASGPDTTCRCDEGYVPGTGNSCVAKTERSVVVEAADFGEVSAAWTGGSAAEGTPGTAPVGEAIVYTANPDVGYYVSAWSGDCASAGAGATSAPDTTVTCDVSAGLADVSAGATFSPIEPCAGRNRVQTNATTCGACLDNHKTADPAEAETGTAQCLPVLSCDGPGQSATNNDTACTVSAQSCSDAGTGYVPSNDGMSCVCNTGHQTENDGTCAECVAPLSDHDNDSGTICQVTAGTCTAAGTGLVPNNDNSACVATTQSCSDAGAGLVPSGDGMSCVCNTGWQTEGDGTCTECVAPLSDHDSDSGTACQVTAGTCTTAGAGLIPANDNLTCVCDTGYQTESNGSCTLCVAPLSDDDSDSSTACRTTTATCEVVDANAVPTGDGRGCECAGTHYDANSGSGTLDCQLRVDCVLPFEDHDSNPATPCQVSEQNCNNFGTGLIANDDLSACVCNTGYQTESDNTCTLCEAPLSDHDNNSGTDCQVTGATCTTAGAGLVPNNDNSECVCDTGYQTESNGSCTECVAPLSDHDNNSGTICEVTAATCTTAGTGLIPNNDNSACVCDTGYQTESNGSCTECVAPLSDHDSNSGTICEVTAATCTTAGTGLIPNNDNSACVCDTGYQTESGGSCTLCEAPYADHDNNSGTACQVTAPNCAAIDTNAVPSNDGSECVCGPAYYDSDSDDTTNVLTCAASPVCTAPQTDHDNNPRTPCRTTDESCRAVDENSVPTSDIQSCECPHLGTYTGSAGGCTSPAASLRQACEAAGWSFFPANNNCSFSINPHFARMQDHETSRRVGLCYLNAGSNQVACEDIAGPRFEFLTVDQVNAASRTYNGFNHYGVYNCPEGAAPNPNDVSECACTAGFEDPNPGDGTLVCEFVDCATIPNAEDGTGENAGTCVCQSGYADSTPDTRALDCDATVTEAQCQNGGVPDSTTGGTTCDCSAARANGFARDPSTGFCTADFDPNACQNGGTVLPSGGCDCRETGYTGDLCDTLNTISNATDAQCAEAGWTTTIPEGGDARAHCDFTGKQFRRTDTALLGGCTTRNRTSADSGRPPCGLMFGENAGDLFYILPTKAEVGDNDIIVSWFYCQNQTPPAIPNADWSACVSAQTSCENGGALRRRGGDTSTGPQVCLCPEGITGERCEVGGTTVPQNRSVGVSASDDGVVSASWTGLATPIAEGGSGDAPTTEAVTYTATPASGYYVSDWTGACATSANPTSRTTGENDAAGAVQTCVVPAGSDNISAGATFEAATDCSADGRSQVNATACGSCTTGYWDGTTCDDTVFAQATFAAKCAAVGGGSDLGYGPLRQNGVEAIHVCVNIGGDADADCIAILSPAFNSNEDVFDNDGNVSFSGTPTCADKFPACAGHEEQVISGNALSGCQTTNGTCQSVDANSVADTQPAGTTCTCPNGGTFTAGQSDGCNAAPTTRAVTIGDSTNGNVVLTVNGAGVSGTGLGTVPADAELVFSAVPANNGYYVSGWTGACASDAANGATGGDLAPGATTTCTVPAGSSAVNVGATFEAVADCATPNRDRDSATTCGACTSPRYYDGTACVEGDFNPTTFQTQCTAEAVDGIYSGIDQPLGKQIGHSCWQIGAGTTGVHCMLITHPDYDSGAFVWDPVEGDFYSPLPLCQDSFPACASHEVQAVSGNQLGGCTTTTASCQSVDANSDTNNSGGCTCTGTGTFDPGSSSGCDAPVVSCPEGTTTNGVCVTSANLAQANACEAAGWTVSADGTECVLHTDTNAFNGPHFYTPFGDTAVSRCNFNAEDGLVPLCSDAVHSDHGYPTASDGANFNGQRRFVYDCDARTSNARPAADYSSCECSPGYSGSWSQTDGCVADPATRAVAVSDAQANGVVSATWSGNATPVAEGGSGNAPTDEAITFTADPDATYYVMEWTGACATSANPTSAGTGSADTADATQTCVVPSGTTDIEAGAIFAEATTTPAGPTAAELEAACEKDGGSGDTWTYYDGGAAGPRCSFDDAGYFVRDQSGTLGDDEFCYLNADVATILRAPTCEAAFGAGLNIPTLDDVDGALDNNFIIYNCGTGARRDSNSNPGVCVCEDSGRAFPQCTDAVLTRSVAVSDSSLGVVSATWSGLATPIAEGASGDAPQTEDVTFTATPDADHYVFDWTGICRTSGVRATGETDAPGTPQTCVIAGEVGAADIRAGATFAAIEPCASRNRVQTNATSCGICLGGFETANPADANDGSVACTEVVLTCTVQNSEASGGVCVCSSGYADPDNATPTTDNPIDECVATIADCMNAGTLTENNTNCNCSTGTHDQDPTSKLCTVERSTTTAPTQAELIAECTASGWTPENPFGDIHECLMSAGGTTLKNFQTDASLSGTQARCVINDGGFGATAPLCFETFGADFPDAADVGGRAVIYNCPDNSAPNSDYSDCVCDSGFTQLEYQSTTVLKGCFANDSDAVACENAGWEYEDFGAGNGPQCNLSPASVRNYSAGATGNARCYYGTPASASDIVCSALFYNGALPGIVGDGTGQVLSHNCPENSTLTRDDTTGSTTCECNTGFSEEERQCVVAADCDIRNRLAGNTPVTCGGCKSGFDNPAGGLNQVADSSVNTFSEIPEGEICVAGTRAVSIGTIRSQLSGGAISADSGGALAIAVGGESKNSGDTVPVTEAVVFTATPTDNTWYVYEWSDNCVLNEAGNNTDTHFAAPTGRDDTTGGIAKVCTVPAGNLAATGGVTFRKVIECGDGRTAGTNTNSACGPCDANAGYAEQDGSCVLVQCENGCTRTGTTCGYAGEDLGFTGATCGVCAADKYRTNRDGTVRCEAPDSGDTATGALICSTATDKGTGSALGLVLNSAGDDCVSECPAGQEAVSNQCQVCGAGTYNPTAGGTCQTCAGGLTGNGAGASVSSGATSCDACANGSTAMSDNSACDCSSVTTLNRDGNSGWSGRLCGTDIDECTAGTDTCSADRECANIGGNYECRCPTGTAQTANTGTNSGTCVASTGDAPTALQVANNCESAGWSLNAAGTHCMIRSADADGTGATLPSCQLAGGPDSETNSNIGCQAAFAGRDENSAPTFPAYNADLDDPATPTANLPRTFVYFCASGSEPSGGNTAGQTQCCALPLTDADMNPTSVCTVTDETCEASYTNSEANGTGTACVCDTGYSGDPATTGCTAFTCENGGTTDGNTCDCTSANGYTGATCNTCAADRVETDRAGVSACETLSGDSCGVAAGGTPLVLNQARDACITECPAGQESVSGECGFCPDGEFNGEAGKSCGMCDKGLLTGGTADGSGGIMGATGCDVCLNGDPDQAGNVCTCPSGYTGRLCGTDVDECNPTTPTHDCTADEVCNNNTGGFSCDCPTGDSRTTSSMTCVADGVLAQANACEAAGWSLNAEGTECRIRSNHGIGGDSDTCALSVSGGCAALFGDPANFPSVLADIGGGVRETSDNTTRRFVASCQGGDEPSGVNTAGQTQCCTAPTTDHDSDSSTACQVTTDTCADLGSNVVPDTSATPPTSCRCADGFGNDDTTGGFDCQPLGCLNGCVAAGNVCTYAGTGGDRGYTGDACEVCAAGKVVTNRDIGNDGDASNDYAQCEPASQEVCALTNQYVDDKDNPTTCVDASAETCAAIELVHVVDSVSGAVTSCTAIAEATCAAVGLVLDKKGTDRTDDDVCVTPSEATCAANMQVYDPDTSANPRACLDSCPAQTEPHATTAGACTACRTNYESSGGGTACTCPTATHIENANVDPNTCLPFSAANCAAAGMVHTVDSVSGAVTGCTTVSETTCDDVELVVNSAGDACLPVDETNCAAVGKIPNASSGATGCVAPTAANCNTLGNVRNPALDSDSSARPLCLDSCSDLTNHQPTEGTAGSCTACTGDYVSDGVSACGCGTGTADPDTDDSNNICRTVLSDADCNNGVADASANGTSCVCDTGWTGDRCLTPPTEQTCADANMYLVAGACAPTCADDSQPVTGTPGACEACRANYASTGGAACSCDLPNRENSNADPAQCLTPDADNCRTLGLVISGDGSECVAITEASCAAANLVIAVDDMGDADPANDVSTCVTPSEATCFAAGKVFDPDATASPRVCLDNCPTDFESHDTTNGACQACRTNYTSSGGSACTCPVVGFVENTTPDPNTCLPVNAQNCADAGKTFVAASGADPARCEDSESAACYTDNQQVHDPVADACAANCPQDYERNAPTNGQCDICSGGETSNAGDACSCGARDDNVVLTLGANIGDCVAPSADNCRDAGMVLNGGVCVAVTKASCEAALMVIDDKDDADPLNDACVAVNEANCGGNNQFFDPRSSGASEICVNNCPDNHANGTAGSGMCAACQGDYTSTNGASCSCAGNTADPNPSDGMFRCLPVLTCGTNATSADNGTRCECTNGWTGDTCETAPTAQSCAAIGTLENPMYLDSDPSSSTNGQCVANCTDDYAGDSNTGTCTACQGDYTSTNGDACDCPTGMADPTPDDGSGFECRPELTCGTGGTSRENGTRCECRAGWTGDLCDGPPTAQSCHDDGGLYLVGGECESTCADNSQPLTGTPGACEACRTNYESTGGAECSCELPNRENTNTDPAECLMPDAGNCTTVGLVINSAGNACVPISVDNCAAVGMVANARDADTPTACVAVSDSACRNIGQVPNAATSPTSCVAVTPANCAVLSQVQDPNNAEQCIAECPADHEGLNFNTAGLCEECSGGQTSQAGGGCACGMNDNKVADANDASICLTPSAANCERAEMVINTAGDACVAVNAGNCLDNGQYFDGVTPTCVDDCPADSVNQTDGSCMACADSHGANFESSGGDDACTCRGVNEEYTPQGEATQCLTPDETNCGLVSKTFSGGVCVSPGAEDCYAQDPPMVFDPTANSGAGGCAQDCGDNYEQVPNTGQCNACEGLETSTRGNACTCSDPNVTHPTSGECLAPSRAACELVGMVANNVDDAQVTACVEVTAPNCLAVGEYVHPDGTDPDAGGSAICLGSCPDDYANNESDGTCGECEGLLTSTGGDPCMCPTPNVTPTTGANNGTCSAPTLENCRDAQMVIDYMETPLDITDDACVAVTSDACDEAGLVINSAGDACVAVSETTCAAVNRIPNALTNPNRCVDATPSACAVLNMVEDPTNAGTCIAECLQDYEESSTTAGMCDACAGGETSEAGGTCSCGGRDDNVLNSDGMCVGSRAVVVNQPDAADGMITLMVNGAGVAAEDLGAVVSDATLVFGAVPADNDHYVLSWSGDCATPGATGETLAGGATTECRIEPGTTEVTVGATFEDVVNCESDRNRVNTNATECGVCIADHTETSDSATCVMDGLLAAANACEAAGWSLANPLQCAIPISPPDAFQDEFQCNFISGTPTSCDAAFGDGSGGYNFPTKTAADDTNPRVFVYGCQGVQDNPSGPNTIGETQCCASPSSYTGTDALNESCEVPASHCTVANSIPNSAFDGTAAEGDSNRACVCSDGSDIPSGGSCPEAAAIDYCPAGQELNEAGTVCTDCGATEYNPTPGGECMVCGDNGTRTSATSCDCDAGYAIGASGECVLASPRAEMVSVAVSELTATPEENYFVEEWIGMDCADADAATGDADDTGSAGAKTCTLATPTDATATVGVVYSYSRGATLATVPADGTGGTLYATVALSVPEELAADDRLSSREYAFIVAVPAAGYRVTSWGAADGVCANAPVSPDDNDTGAKVCVIRPGDDDVNVTVTFTAVAPPSGGGGGL